MPDLEKVIQALKECAHSEECGKCPYVTVEFCEFEAMADAAVLLETMYKAWQMIKYSVIETANNNAGPDGNEDVYRILTWVATMMGQQEAKWDARPCGLQEAGQKPLA